jgi:hypothetical protein
VYTIRGFNSRSAASIGSINLEDFIDFLSNAELLSLARQNKRHQLWRKALFQPGSTIYRVCQLPPQYDAWETDLVPVYTRLAALMHINAALWEYKDSPISHDQYLGALDRILIDGDFATSLSIGFFVYSMMKLDYDEVERNYSNSSPTEEPEKRSWFVARILRVCKLLGKPSMIKVHRALLGFLESSSIVSIEDLGLSENWTDKLRLEIISSRSASAEPPTN